MTFAKLLVGALVAVILLPFATTAPATRAMRTHTRMHAAPGAPVAPDEAATAALEGAALAGVTTWRTKPIAADARSCESSGRDLAPSLEVFADSLVPSRPHQTHAVLRI